MEIIFKIFLTALVVFFGFGSIKWIWRSQIDVKETGRQLLNTPRKSMDWVATRDDTKIYQEGKIVGTICGEVKESNDQIIFKEICDIEQLNTNAPFEYKRDKIKIVNIGGIHGGMSIATTEGAISKNAFITDVVCERIK